MKAKLIAVGNRLMGDEGIAIKIAEKLSDELNLLGIDVIIGETDVDFCFENMKINDYILLLDATCYGIEPGTITLVPLNKNSLYINHSLTQHDLSLIRLLDNSEHLTGYLIGIEVNNIDFDLQLSKQLQDRFPLLCEKIKSLVIELKARPNDAASNLVGNTVRIV